MLYKNEYEVIERNERVELIKERVWKYDPVENKTYGSPEIYYHVNEINGDWLRSYKTLKEAKTAYRDL